MREEGMFITFQAPACVCGHEIVDGERYWQPDDGDPICAVCCDSNGLEEGGSDDDDLRGGW